MLFHMRHQTGSMTNLWIAAESTLGKWKTIPLIISPLKVSHVLKLLCSQGWLFTQHNYKNFSGLVFGKYVVATALLGGYNNWLT